VIAALTGLGQVVPVLIGLVLATVVWPVLIVPRASIQGWTAWFGPFVTGLAIWIAFTTVMAVVHAVQLTTLVGLAVFFPLLLRAVRRRTSPAPTVVEAEVPSELAPLPIGESGVAQTSDGVGGQPNTLAIFQAIEATSTPGAPPPAALSGATTRARGLLGAVARLFGRTDTLLLAAVLVAVALVQVWPSLLDPAPATPAGYQELLVAKTVALGGGMFSAGLAPVGLPAILAAFSTLTSADQLNVLRLVQPLAAVLLAGAAAGVAETLTRSRWAAVAAAAMVGLTRLVGAGLPAWSPVDPEAGHLAMALALVLIVLALRLALATASGGVARVALTACAYVVGALDPGTGLLAILVVVPVLLAGQGRSGRLDAALALGGWALSLWPIAVGYAMHTAPVPLLWTTGAVLSPPLGRLGDMAAPVLASLLLLVHGYAYRGRTGLLGRVQAAYAIGLLLVAAVLVVGPPVLVDHSLRDGALNAFAIALLVAWAFSYALAGASHASGRSAAAVCMSVAAIGLVFQGSPTLPLFEPPGSALTYLQIAGSLPKYTWTIVSPVTQYPEVLGSGWHTELGVFLQDYSIGDAANPSWLPKDNPTSPIQTPQIFLFVNLDPPGLGRPIDAADGLLPLPSTITANTYSGLTGASIEAHALAWVRAYLSAHPASALIYEHSAQLEVLYIHQ